ncbi:MAG: peptide chain release factor N(5)-glutamine methyltransferase [Fermentimonas sp.]|jgi:release factor glutamine methyltransferase
MALVPLKQLARYLQRELGDIYSSGEIVALSRLLFHELREGLPAMVVTGKCNHLSTTYSRAASFLMKEEDEVSFWDTAKVTAVVEVIRRLKTGEPVQYIVGRTEFHGLMLHVTPDVLIPRPETEELVEWVLDELPSGKLKLLDVGTGSGCIAVALGKRRPDIEVYACDSSGKAIAVAQRNARENEVDVNFFVWDILVPLSVSFLDNGSFHAVVSNPPYVLESERAVMEANVLDFEPPEALFVPDRSSLLFYERIADLSLSLLGEGGYLFFEVNQSKGDEVRTMLFEKGYRNVKLRSDMAANPRMVRAIKP